jgi:N-acetylmuramoyl-L-alanine amidase
MAISISNHRVAGAPLKGSPNHGGPYGAGLPDALIIHFTAGASVESSVSWLCNPQAKASAHVVVGRDGSITQLVPFDQVAWHAGASSYGGRSGYNQYSIGIEMDYPGRLQRTAGGGYISAFGRAYPADQVISAVHRNEQTPSNWLVYPEVQVNAVFDLCAALCSVYAIRQILGHEEIAPGRKDDPGPAFPLDRLCQRLILRGRDSNDPYVQPTATPSSPVTGPLPAATPAPQAAPAAPASAALGYVTADLLNIRHAPNPAAPLVAAPLRRGTLVEVLNQQAGWYRVQAGTVGWVKGEYLRL